MYLFSSTININELGENIGCWMLKENRAIHDFCLIAQQTVFIIGASAAWHKKIYDFFGPLSKDIIFEDRIFPLRATLIGDVAQIKEPLIKYRRHSNSISRYKGFKTYEAIQERKIVNMKRWLNVTRDNIRDIELYYEHIGLSGEAEFILKYLRKKQNEFALKIKFESIPFLEKMMLIIKAVIGDKISVTEFTKMLLRLSLPGLYTYRVERIVKKGNGTKSLSDDVTIITYKSTDY